MNQGADRRRSFHRVGQPHVQWQLCTLADGSAEQQEADRQQSWLGNLAHVEKYVVVIQGPLTCQRCQTAKMNPDQEDPDRQAEVPHSVYQESLLRR